MGRGSNGGAVLVPSACALGDGGPLGEETLGIGDWGLGEKAEGSRAFLLHDLPFTIRADRRFGRDVADLGMAGEKVC